MNSHFKALGVVLAAACSLAIGCAAPVDSSDDKDETVGEAEQELTCSDAGCTGLNPYATSCVLDQQAVDSKPIKDQFGVQIGSVTLYYSQSCHAIWGYAGFNASHGNFQVCATNATNVSQPSQCLSYGSTTFGAVSKMQFLRVNDKGYASVSITTYPFGSGGTGLYTRTF